MLAKYLERLPNYARSGMISQQEGLKHKQHTASCNEKKVLGTDKDANIFIHPEIS